jgi:hypothetical protein
LSRELQGVLDHASAPAFRIGHRGDANDLHVGAPQEEGQRAEVVGIAAKVRIEVDAHRRSLRCGHGFGERRGRWLRTPEEEPPAGDEEPETLAKEAGHKEQPRFIESRPDGGCTNQ